MLVITFFFGYNLYAQPIDMDQVSSMDEFHWGVNAFHQGFYGKAAQSFEKALTLKPDNILIQTWLAKTYYRNGFEDTALSIWNSILQTEHKSSLLENLVYIIETRRGLGPELLQPEEFVVHYEIDANHEDYYNFKRPSAVITNKDGTFLVVAYGSSEILKYNQNSFIMNIYKGGIERFNHPFDVLQTEEYIFVSEFEGNRISKCNLNYERITHLVKKESAKESF